MPGKIISKRDEVVMGEVVMSGWLEDKGAISSSVLQGLAPKKVCNRVCPVARVVRRCPHFLKQRLAFFT